MRPISILPHLSTSCLVAMAMALSGCFFDAEQARRTKVDDGSTGSAEHESGSSDVTGAPSTTSAVLEDSTSVDEPGSDGSGIDVDESSSDSEGTIATLPDPIGHWPFDGDLLDIGPNGYHAQAFGSFDYEDGPGGMAIRFGSQSDYISISGAGPSVLESLESFTISMWVHADDWSSTRTLMFLGKLYSQATADNLFWIRVVGGNVNILTETRGGTNHVTGIDAAPPSAQWHHIALTFDGTDVSYYVDCVFSAESSMVMPETSTTNLLLGATDQSLESYSFEGKISDVRMYDLALDADHVALLCT